MRREKKHQALCELMVVMNENKDARPVSRFVNENFKKIDERLLVAEWLSTHSCFRFNLSENGLCKVKINNKKRDKLIPVPHEKPYYIHKLSEESNKKIQEKEAERQKKISDLQQRASESRAVKIIRKAFDQYIKSRSRADYNELCHQLRQLHEFGLTDRALEESRISTAPNANFVSGGAPGLGKRSS